MDQSPKLFILIDKRLSRSQQAVQASHAAIDFALLHGKEWTHQSVVLLGVDGADELEQWYDWFDNQPGYKVSFFREPYYDDRMTAVCCHGCDDEVKELRLL